MPKIVQAVYLRRALHLVPGEGGTCENLDGDALVIFWGLKFGQMLFFGLLEVGAILLLDL